MANNKKMTSLKTPAGDAPSFTAAAGFKDSNIKKVVLFGSFGVDGASAPVTNRGDPFSVVRTSQGLYTITLGGATALLGQYGVKQTLSFVCSLQSGAASALMAQPGQVSDSGGTFQVRVVTMATGAVADPAAAGTNERINFTICFNNGAL